MAGEYEDAILRDLRAHLQTAKIPLENLSTLAQKGDDQLVQQFLTENIQINGSGPEAKQSQLYIEIWVRGWTGKPTTTNLYAEPLWHHDKRTGNWAVKTASFWGIKEIVRELLHTGINPSKQNKGSLWTPLHAATFQEHGPVVMLLLENDAQPELPDAEGRTPKDFASASDKIWPLFAAMQLERTSRAELIDKHIIRKAEYSGPAGGGHGDRYMQAAMMGDVLAEDPDQQFQGGWTGGEQPQLSVWK